MSYAFIHSKDMHCRKRMFPINEFDNNGRSNICKYHNASMSTEILKNDIKESLVT